MWQVPDHRQVEKELSARGPIKDLKRYEKWKDVDTVSGPAALRAIRGFRDEPPAGKRKGHPSFRLGEQGRVIDRVQRRKFFALVVRVSPHAHGRPGDEGLPVGSAA